MTASIADDNVDIAIVGAGLAGLVAARTALAAGRSVTVVEASDGVGGRVRSDVVDGFILDRGFQVLLTAYPEAIRQLDYEALQLRRFEPGALVWRGGRTHVVADPFRAPRTLAATAVSPIGSPIDKARIALMRRRLRSVHPATLLGGADTATGPTLTARGFSPKMIDRFFRPLFGGIQLDPELRTSRRMFDVIFRMLADGDSAVPAAGMGAIPASLAASLAPGVVRLNEPVTSVTATSLVTEAGVIQARSVIVATDGPTAASLAGSRPVGSRAVSCVYFAAPAAPSDTRYVILNGTGSGPVLNVAIMSNVAPSYAPAGQHLIAAAMPGEHHGDVAAAARQQLTGWWGAQVGAWRHLATYKIAHGQPDQSPPFSPKRSVRLGNGVFVCGDHRDTGSIQGAMYSGRRCAEAAIQATI